VQGILRAAVSNLFGVVMHLPYVAKAEDVSKHVRNEAQLEIGTPDAQFEIQTGRCVTNS
jgi:hypothetical protein